MSYTRTFTKAIPVSGTVTVSYPASSHGGVKTASYLLAFGISEAFASVVMVLTRGQIRKVDMNDSLKSGE